jgi:hypothetical protein
MAVLYPGLPGYRVCWPLAAGGADLVRDAGELLGHLPEAVWIAGQSLLSAGPAPDSLIGGWWLSTGGGPAHRDGRDGPDDGGGCRDGDGGRYPLVTAAGPVRPPWALKTAVTTAMPNTAPRVRAAGGSGELRLPSYDLFS